MPRWEERLTAINEYIRTGRGTLARAELRDLRKRPIPRRFAGQMAALARRANLPSLAIRVLNPIVRPGSRAPSSASEEESAEYAASLIRIGALQEAIEILATLDSRAHPEVLLFQTFALVAQWKYAPTIPLLQEYVRSPHIDEYQRLVGMVNLANALVYERRFESATEILRELLAQTEAKKLYLLHGNSLELSAHNALYQGHWQEAGAFLERSWEALKHTGTLDAFFVDKWKAILQLRREGPTAEALRKVRAVCTEARERSHWETVRDCDRFTTIATGDRALFLHLYMGTPYPSFRRRICQELGADPALPSIYRWKLARGRNPAVCDLASSELVDRGKAHRLKEGQLSYRLLAALSSDFYKPARLASLHYQLYPDDYFDPVHSPARLHQAVDRLRREIRRLDWPLVIEERAGLYRLTAARPCVVKLPCREPAIVDGELPVRRLFACFGMQAFSVSEAARQLGQSPRNALRLLREGVERGTLARSGRGPACRYQFVRQNPKSPAI